MTKAELIKALEPFPDTMEVFMDERKSEFHYGLLNSVEKRKILFTEDPYPDPDEIDESFSAWDDVVVLTEE